MRPIVSSLLQVACKYGHYCVNGTSYICPNGTYGNTTGLSTPMCSGPCPNGRMCQPPGTQDPYPCPAGYYCNNATVIPCPAGRHSNGSGVTLDDCVKCAPGTYLPTVGYVCCWSLGLLVDG